jgi:hypothetical protein
MPNTQKYPRYPCHACRRPTGRFCTYHKHPECRACCREKVQ